MPHTHVLSLSSLPLYAHPTMKSTNEIRFLSSSFSSFSSATITTTAYALQSDHSPPQSATEIPIESLEPPIPITVHLPSTTTPSSASAAAMIQAAYRSHVIRSLVKRIKAVRLAVDHLERQIQRQETVDAIRTNPRERLRIDEALMRQLLELDSVPGRFDATVRDLRRSLSRRVVGLQEVVDGICHEGSDGWGCWGWRDWDELLEETEKGVCIESGGDELERFCAEKLGFRCLERFLREP